MHLMHLWDMFVLAVLGNNFTKELSWETLEDCHLCGQLQSLAADYKSGIYYYNCLDIWKLPVTTEVTTLWRHGKVWSTIWASTFTLMGSWSRSPVKHGNKRMGIVVGSSRRIWKKLAYFLHSFQGVVPFSSVLGRKHPSWIPFFNFRLCFLRYKWKTSLWKRGTKKGFLLKGSKRKSHFV